LNFTANIDVQVLQGNKVLEIRNSGVSKSRAAGHWMSKSGHDFILAVGDDWTDEDLFQSLPAKTYSLRVGLAKTCARFNVRHSEDVCDLLQLLALQRRPLKRALRRPRIGRTPKKTSMPAS
jgi:trehalose 6-phosphate synthase/phosphatase